MSICCRVIQPYTHTHTYTHSHTHTKAVTERERKPAQQITSISHIKFFAFHLENQVTTKAQTKAIAQ